MHVGDVVGTPAYMSPEHARGQVVDKRTDIWAFGCVLFEMLSGRAAFQRETTTDTIAAVLEREPDWAALPQDTPAGVRRLLQRCLAKDPRQRLHDIADARLEIADVLADPPQSAAAPGRTRPRVIVPVSVAAIVLALVAIGTAIWTRRPGPPAPSASWLEINTTPTTDPAVAISPDGSKIVFVGSSEGRSQLWLRSLDSPAARPLRGDRAWHTAVLVAQRPLHRVFRCRPVEEDGHRWRLGDNVVRLECECPWAEPGIATA